MDCFSELGLKWDADESGVRRAYAALIKQYRPESHPAEFARIREAYEAALRISRMRREHPELLEDLDQEEQWQDEAEQFDDLWPDAPEAQSQQPDAPAGQSPARLLRSGQIGSVAGDPQAYVEEMIRELDAQVAEGDEAQSLQAYNAQWQAMSALSLDLQMDYAQALREWVLYSGRAPMQLILEAAERFGWHDQAREVERDYGRAGGHRLEMLLELADHYAEARDSRSPYLQIDGAYGRSPPLIASHHRTYGARRLMRQWRAACDQAEMPALAGRLRYGLPRRVQIYWLDVLLALFAAVMIWLAIGPVPDWRGWAALVLLSPAVLFAPALVRVAAGKLGADTPLRLAVNLGRRYRDWRARKLVVAGDDAVLTREITLTILLGALLIFGVLVLAKNSGAVLLPVMLFLAFMALTALYMLYNMMADMEAWLTGYLLLLAHLPQRFKARRVQGQRPLHEQPPAWRQRRRRTAKSAGKRATARKFGWRWWWALLVASQMIRLLSKH